VYKTDIDAQQQKVVVIGNVSADALVKKLLKTGKHAEPWPEPPPPGPDGSPGGGKKKKKKSKNAANSQPAEPADGGPSPPDNAAACEEGPDGEHDKPDEGGGKFAGAGDARDGGAGKFAPVAMTPHGPQPGGGGKKKGGHGNANANGDAGAIVGVHAPMNRVPVVDAGAIVGVHAPMNPVPVVDAGPHLPPTMSPGHYGAAGVHSPAYAMSYNTAHPSPALRSSTNYHPMVGLAYGTGGGGGYNFYSPGSYYMFSEENANACSVM
jgi:hypothetical protein